MGDTENTQIKSPYPVGRNQNVSNAYNMEACRGTEHGRHIAPILEKLKSSAGTVDLGLQSAENRPNKRYSSKRAPY